MSNIDFRNLTYLKQGNVVQQRIGEVLEQYRIMETLKFFDPVLIGTFPIDIAIESSDLDIACCFEDREGFIQVVETAFSSMQGYVLTEVIIATIPTVVVNFTIAEFPVELFAQSIGVDQQNGYRHMLIEYTILQSKDEVFRQDVIKLKESGIKTEPAFAQLLGLKGDPYEALLMYKNS